MTTLLDANVLIALTVLEHVHHDAAEAWFTERGDGPVAVCPSTQGSLVRALVRGGLSAADAQAMLATMHHSGRYEFWPDTLSYRDVPLDGVIGHRQITDAYLAQLARSHDGRLATFDQGLAKLHGDVADLVPVQAGTPDERRSRPGRD